MSIGACVHLENRLAPDLTSMELVCEKLEEELGETCGDLPPPTIVVSDIVGVAGIGVRGIYMPGENTIFIRPGLSIALTYEIIVHETVHYVLHQLEIERNRCASESYARTWTAELLDTPYDETWRQRYGCTMTPSKLGRGM